jgi:uncharacterized protein (DUF433 family)
MAKKGSRKAAGTSRHFASGDASGGVKRSAGAISSSGRGTSGKSQLVNTGTDKRYVRGASGGQFTDSDDVGTSLAADRRDSKRSQKIVQPMADSYVRTDASGAMRVGDTDVPLDSVVAAFHQGHSPEMIRAQYPSLTLEAVYGAIAYYLANRGDVDAYLKRQDALWEQWRAQTRAPAAPVVGRLKNARNPP